MKEMKKSGSPLLKTLGEMRNSWMVSKEFKNPLFFMIFMASW